MATPPYGRRGKSKSKAKPKRTRPNMPSPSASAFEHASPNARFKRAGGMKPPATKQGRTGRPGGGGGGRKAPVSTSPSPGRVSIPGGETMTPLASSAKVGRGGRFTTHAGAKAGRPMGARLATTHSGPSTAPKSPRPVPGAKGPHPSAQAIAHASPRARFKRDSGTTAPAPTGLQGRAKKVKPLMPRGRAKKIGG